jgi:hypothetical protein
MPLSDYTPTVAMVGALLRSRTRDDQGSEIGTFTAVTRPTDTEVDVLIQDAVDETYPVFGQDIPDAPGTDPDALRKAATRIVALRAAALVEQGYFPEQVTIGRSAYPTLMESYNALLERFVGALGDAASGDDPGASSDYQTTVSSFPDASGMIGLETKF